MSTIKLFNVSGEGILFHALDNHKWWSSWGNMYSELLRIRYTTDLSNFGYIILRNISLICLDFSTLTYLTLHVYICSYLYFVPHVPLIYIV